MRVTLRVIDAAGQNLAERTADDEVCLAYGDAYREGDRLQVEVSEPGHVWLAFDAALSPAMLYLREGLFSFTIPFGEKRMPYAPQAFLGSVHRLHVRRAEPCEIAARRNLAFNPLDQHGNRSLFPRAEANVETRGEAQFAARNAIDGEKTTFDHGSWPFTSWGINKDPEAALTIDFGRPVKLDELILYLRADFLHDAWWRAASVSFSDGTTMELSLVKSGQAQKFALEPRLVGWVRLHSLIKADDPSPYPALSQIELWGTEA